MASRRIQALSVFTTAVTNAYPECVVKQVPTTSRAGKAYKQLLITRYDKVALQYVPVMEWRTGTFVDLDIVRTQAIRVSNSTSWLVDQEVAATIACHAKDD